MAKKTKDPQIKIVPQLLATRADMERAFADLRTAAIERDRLAAEREKQINTEKTRIDLEYEPQIAAQNRIITQHAASLIRWALSNRPEFGKLRSLETAFGWLKFRTGQFQLKCKLKSWAKVIEKIKSFGLEALYVRTVEEVNKEALIADRESDLLARARKIKITDLGVAAVQEERFTIEVKREELPEPQIIIDEPMEAETTKA